VSVKMNHRQFEFNFPAEKEPEWAAKVDRWYQLDAFAFGLTQACFAWQKSGELGELPSLLLLACPEASNETDWNFARTGAASPAKFVHTLPSLRASSFCQVMNWSGPMLCFQKDPETIATALSEGAQLLSQQWPVIWVVSVLRDCTGSYCAHVFVLRAEMTKAAFEVVPGNARVSQDRYLISWLGAPTSESQGLPNDNVIRRISLE
jgi:hypothetical protein